jgi:hypothetical protein
VQPSAASSRTSVRTSRVPCGSRPLVGSSSTNSSRGRSSAAARPEPLLHAERVGAEALAAAAPSPTRSRAASMRAGSCAVDGEVGGVEADEVGAPDRYGWNAGPSTSAPTRGRTRRWPAGSARRAARPGRSSASRGRAACGSWSSCRCRSARGSP